MTHSDNQTMKQNIVLHVLILYVILSIITIEYYRRKKIIGFIPLHLYKLIPNRVNFVEKEHFFFF